MSSDELLYDPIDIQPIPAGEYYAHVTSAALVTSKAGLDYVACEIKILQGSQSGKTVHTNFHINAKDPRFRQDSRRKLTKLTTCCGIGNITKNNLALLCEKSFIVEVGETTDNFGSTNNVLGFERIAGK